MLFKELYSWRRTFINSPLLSRVPVSADDLEVEISTLWSVAMTLPKYYAKYVAAWPLPIVRSQATLREATVLDKKVNKERARRSPCRAGAGTRT
jgi:hypothetical protein